MEEKTLFSASQIDRRVSEIAREVRAEFAGSESRSAFLWLEAGAKNFAEALLKKTALDIPMVSIKVSSYGNSKKSSGVVKIERGEEALGPLRGKKVLLIDDILDTGATAKFVSERLRQIGAAEIKTCFLLNKTSSNKGSVKPDFCGFEVGDKFLFGFGLDLNGGQRELPCIKYLAE